MTATLACLRREVLASMRLWLLTVVAVFVGFHVFQLALLVARFETLPNYLTVHNWPGNVAGIIRSTPSVLDMIPIIADEWFIEVGSMNYAFGRGIAEWSFVLMPAKAAVVLVIAMLVAINLVLLRASWKACSLPQRFGTSVATSTGALMAAAAVTSITWVVCCAAPTWVVSLAVMGVSVTTALALQPVGGWLSLVGLLVLSGIALVQIRFLLRGRRSEITASAMPMNIQIVRVPS
jgi:hypothetical protein